VTRSPAGEIDRCDQLGEVVAQPLVEDHVPDALGSRGVAEGDVVAVVGDAIEEVVDVPCWVGDLAADVVEPEGDDLECGRGLVQVDLVLVRNVGVRNQGEAIGI
jgi:hypothetical protein